MKRIILVMIAVSWLTGCCEAERVPFSVEPTSVTRGAWAEVRVQFEADVADPSDSTGGNDSLRVVLTENNGSHSLAAYTVHGTSDEMIRNLRVEDARTVRFELNVPETWTAGSHNLSVQFGSSEYCSNRGDVSRLTVE